MKTLFDRKVQIDGKEVTRNVTIKGGEATVRDHNQKKTVSPNGNYLDKTTVWTVNGTTR